MTGSSKDKPRRLWGRAQGRPLSQRQAELVETHLPKVSVSKAAPFGHLSERSDIWLEVGFGGGEHFLHMAKTYPDMGIIGIEPFLNGVAKAVTGIVDDGLSNAALHHGDARDIMDEMPDACLSKIFVLFPDPWPKARHFKRRLLSAEFIAEIYRLLKPGGTFRFASDIISYVDWTLERVDAFETSDGKGFIWEPKDANAWREPYADWPGTRYEAKAHREDRVCHYFEFAKPK